MARLTPIGFAAGDTLGRNEAFFRVSQARVAALLADDADPAHPAGRLEAAVRRHPGACGSGVRGFVPTMIETATEAG